MFKCLCTRLAQGDCQGLTIRVAVDDMVFQWPKYLYSLHIFHWKTLGAVLSVMNECGSHLTNFGERLQR